jgi:hypothetical protein
MNSISSRFSPSNNLSFAGKPNNLPRHNVTFGTDKSPHAGKSPNASDSPPPYEELSPHRSVAYPEDHLNPNSISNAANLISNAVTIGNTGFLKKLLEQPDIHPKEKGRALYEAVSRSTMHPDDYDTMSKVVNMLFDNFEFDREDIELARLVTKKSYSNKERQGDIINRINFEDSQLIRKERVLLAEQKAQKKHPLNPFKKH